MSAANKLIQAASGGASDPVYVEDVYSTHIYKGTGSSLSINNGIDLNGEGGLTWIKNRDATDSHVLTDTERGATKILSSNSSSGQTTDSDTLTAFNSDGFTLGADVKVNTSGEDYVSYSFRKQEKFFTVVKYSGTGSATSINHDLGSIPGMILVKRTGSSKDWWVYHVGSNNGNSPETKYQKLNGGPHNEADSTTAWNDTAPTATEFTLGTSTNVNADGEEHIAYLFANNDQSFGDDSDEAIVKCGHFSANGSGEADVNLGFEPQWIIFKRHNSSTAGDWFIVDNMRGWHAEDRDSIRLKANDNTSEGNFAIFLNATGFTGNGFAASGAYIYTAIRRPMKTPQYGTDVFSPYGYSDTGLTSGSGTASNRTIINGGSNGGSGFPVDVFMHKTRTTSTYGFHVFDRLRGKGKSLLTNSTAAEPAGDGASNGGFAFQEGVDVEYNGEMYYYTSGAGGRSHITYHLRRATGFMDVVYYSGNSTAGRQITHNLKTVPNMIIIKNRGAGEPWYVYHEGTDSSAPEDYHTLLNSTAARVDSVEMMNDTAPTASVFSVSQYNSVNGSGKTYIAYLFATLAGVSKVGTYTGSGSSQTINCGFSSSARLVLIKKTSSTGNWLVFDSVRGISVGATDGTLTLDTNTQDYTEQVFFSNDVIQPDNTGFKVLSTASLINSSGADYIFLAIA